MSFFVNGADQPRILCCAGLPALARMPPSAALGSCSASDQVAGRKSARRRGKLMAWLVAVALNFIPAAQYTARGQVGPSSQQVKAQFLIGFPKYVDWPATCFAETNSPIILTIYGDNEQGEAIRMIIAGKSVNGHPLALRIATNEEECLSGGHVLFIGASEQRQAAAIVRKLAQTSILTVGESPGFLDLGGMINLVHRNQNIRLEVNLGAAMGAHLKISSKLLSVADHVMGKAN